MMYKQNEFEELTPWFVIVITLIGGVLRLMLLGNKGLWMDETFSMWIASHSVADMLHWIVTIDQHPPLYYLLLHYWMALNGDTPSDLRMLSALFSTATIPVIYLIGKRMSGRMVGLIASIILAVSPFNIRFAQEARMFTLLTFNASVAIYALVRLLTDPRAFSRPIGSQFREYLHAWRTGRPVEPDGEEDFSYKDESRKPSRFRAWIYRHRWLPIQAIETDLAWVVFIIFSALTLLSHNTAVLFPLATNIFILGLMLFQRGKQPTSPPNFKAPSFGNWVKAQFGIFLLWSPWMVAFIQQASRVYQDFWLPKPTWGTLIQTIETFLDESTMGQFGQALWIWVLFAVVLCLGLLYFRKKISLFVFLAALFAIPFLGELAVSLRRPVFLDRTLIWTTIPLFLLLAAGITQIRFRFLIIVVVGVLGTVSLFSAGDYYRFMHKEDWSDPAGFVANFAQKDDLVLFNASRAQIPFDYYFTPYEDLYAIQVEKHGVPVDMFDSGLLEPKMTESDIPGLLSMLSGHSKVWLVYSHNENTDPNGLIPQTLASVMNLVVTRDYYGVQVQLYMTP
jgi:hypothetical protein